MNYLHICVNGVTVKSFKCNILLFVSVINYQIKEATCGLWLLDKLSLIIKTSHIIKDTHQHSEQQEGSSSIDIITD